MAVVSGKGKEGMLIGLSPKFYVRAEDIARLELRDEKIIRVSMNDRIFYDLEYPSLISAQSMMRLFVKQINLRAKVGKVGMNERTLC